MIVIRKLAALDVAFLGPLFIIAEFTLGVAGPLVLGGVIAVRGHSWKQYLMALYFVALGMNYVPLLLYAILLRDRNRAHEVIAPEVNADRAGMMRRYRRGSLLLLVPFLVPLLALTQARAAPTAMVR